MGIKNPPGAIYFGRPKFRNAQNFGRLKPRTDTQDKLKDLCPVSYLCHALKTQLEGTNLDRGIMHIAPAPKFQTGESGPELCSDPETSTCDVRRIGPE